MSHPTQRSNTLYPLLLFLTGIILAITTSVYATSIGTNVSVDNTLSASGALSITSTSATSTFSTGGFTIGTNQFVVEQTSGNVGVGTTVLNTWKLKVQAPTGWQRGLAVYGNDANAAYIALDAASASALGIQGANNNSTLPIALQWQGGNVGIGTTSPPLPLSVLSNNGNSAYFAGNVGIGTNAPGQPLHVNGSVLIGNRNGGGQRLIVSGAGTGANTGIVLYGVDSGTPTTGYLALDIYQTGVGSIQMADNNSTKPLSLQPQGGNVGIGTSTPNSLFHVSAGTSATTTVEFGDQYAAGSKTCFNVKNSAGTAVSFYVGSANTIVVEMNRCR